MVSRHGRRRSPASSPLHEPRRRLPADPCWGSALSHELSKPPGQPLAKRSRRERLCYPKKRRACRITGFVEDGAEWEDRTIPRKARGRRIERNAHGYEHVRPCSRGSEEATVS